MEHPRTLARAALVMALLMLMAGCATSKQMEATHARLDQISAQLDLLVENTRRDTLTQIFGEESEVIVERIDKMDTDERQQFETLISEYQKGATTLNDVRSGMVSLLGGGDREVASAQGIWIRDLQGKKIKAVSRGSALTECRRLEASEIPTAISEKEVLLQYDWGVGQLDGQQVIFPWDFTMSTFTKEIVENTARRTAEEFMRMSGDKGMTRPIYIQVTTEPGTDGVKIKYPTEEGEIYLTDERGNKAPPPPPKPGQQAP